MIGLTLVITKKYVSHGFLEVSKTWRMCLELLALLIMFITLIINLVSIGLMSYMLYMEEPWNRSSMFTATLISRVVHALLLLLILVKSTLYWTTGPGREDRKPSEVVEDPVTIKLINPKAASSLRYYHFIICEICLFVIQWFAISGLFNDSYFVHEYLSITIIILSLVLLPLVYFYSTDMWIFVPLLLVYFCIHRLYPHKVSVSRRSLQRNHNISGGGDLESSNDGGQVLETDQTTIREAPPPSYSEAVLMNDTTSYTECENPLSVTSMVPVTVVARNEDNHDIDVTPDDSDAPDNSNTSDSPATHGIVNPCYS